VALKEGPLTIRMRTANRNGQVELPSLTPIWRSAEFQEREIFDLFGIVSKGHPDLRRLLMWPEFKDHPMRRDYVEPDDLSTSPRPTTRCWPGLRHTGRERGRPMTVTDSCAKESRRAGTGLRSSSRTAKESCWKWPWGRITLRRTASSAGRGPWNGERRDPLKPVFGYLHRNHESWPRG